MTHTAAITRINEHLREGWRDTIVISGPDGDDIEAITVEPSEESDPYVAALAAAGWLVTGTTAERQDCLGNDAWTVTSQPRGA